MYNLYAITKSTIFFEFPSNKSGLVSEFKTVDSKYFTFFSYFYLILFSTLGI